MKPLIPCLWFDHNAEEAVKFYISVFKNSRIGRISRYTEAGKERHGHKPGSVLMIEFTLGGRPFTALNAGPGVPFTPAVSFQIWCKTQKEADYYFNKLSKGGDKSAQVCGWLKDKYGLSWQIGPVQMGRWLTDKRTSKRDSVMTALMSMKKLDFKKLKQAYDRG